MKGKMKSTIPWDYDIDAGMMRRDAERLMAHLKNSSEFYITLIYGWYLRVEAYKIPLAKTNEMSYTAHRARAR